MKMSKFIIVIVLLGNSAYANQPWQLITEESHLNFTASYDGILFDGKFERFNVELMFDSNDLSNSSLKSQIDVTSVNSNSRDRDEALADPAWFHFSKYPQATFTSTSFTTINENLYQVTGLLTIRNQQREIAFPFQWLPVADNQAKVDATLTLDRRDFDIGSGDWADDETIGFLVTVKISLLLNRTL